MMWAQSGGADRLVISVPSSEAAVLKYFQARMPYGIGGAGCRELTAFKPCDVCNILIQGAGNRA